MAELSKKLGEMEYESIVADLTPPVETRGRTIRGLDAETTLKRGTVMAISSKDSKLVVLGTKAGDSETLTPDSILCDDTVVGTDDVTAVVYTAGCFKLNKLTTADDNTISDADMDTLRKYGIVFKTTVE